jgi:hypothetical protein
MGARRGRSAEIRLRRRTVAPSLVEEPAGLIEMLKVRAVRLGAPKVDPGNLKVGPVVAAVVGLAVVGRDPRHHVGFREGLGVSVDEICGLASMPSLLCQSFPSPVDNEVNKSCLEPTLCRLPQARNRILVLVQRDDKPVGAVVVLHDLERVVRDVAQELDVGLDAPVVLVRVEERVFEKEAGLVPTHLALCQPSVVSRLRSSQEGWKQAPPVARTAWDPATYIGDRPPVRDRFLPHLVDELVRFRNVNPLGKVLAPVLRRHLTELDLAGADGRDVRLELVVERFVVEEGPVVVELAVEAVLDLTDRVERAPDVRVSGRGPLLVPTPEQQRRTAYLASMTKVAFSLSGGVFRCSSSSRLTPGILASTSSHGATLLPSSHVSPGGFGFKPSLTLAASSEVRCE